MIQIETKRLLIREPRVTDAKGFADFFRKNKKFHNRPDRPSGYYTERFWKRKILQERKEAETDLGLRLYFFLKDKPKTVVGMAGFSNISRGFFQSCTLGYLLGEEFEGQGLMTEALKKTLPMVMKELDLHRCSAAHVPKNLRSCRVMKKLGFKVVGIEPKYLRINGRWEDHELHTYIVK